MNRPLIGIFGRTNVGKSSLLNFLTAQASAIVSSEAGTTTDPVRKGFEILGFAAVTFVDTAGIDDSSTLGAKRMAKTMALVQEVDLALLVTDSPCLMESERALIEQFALAAVPYVLIYNNFRGLGEFELSKIQAQWQIHSKAVSTSLSGSTEVILESIKSAIPESSLLVPSFFGGRVRSGDVVVMVCPIDSEAPSGRLILPQVQAIRSALDEGVVAIVVQPSELDSALKLVPAPRLIVTDSQLFGTIHPPQGVELTSFSILLSELKGDPEVYARGLTTIDNLKSGDRILIIENCSHQTSCDDIGRVKIPRWLRSYSGHDDLQFEILAPRDPMPEDLSLYRLAIQCGGCMVSRRSVQNRIRGAVEAALPITNYGMLIKYVTRKR